MGAEDRDPPEQLPIVLQVLLSQVHRLRALDLLGRFLDLGPWAVNLVSVQSFRSPVDFLLPGAIIILILGVFLLVDDFLYWCHISE